MTIQQRIAEVPELGMANVLFSYPQKTAAFPVCILYNFLTRQKYRDAAYDLQIIVELWANKYLEAVTLYDKVALKLKEIAFNPTNQIYQSADITTGKERYGSAFECRWNAITGQFEPNR